MPKSDEWVAGGVCVAAVVARLRHQCHRLKSISCRSIDKQRGLLKPDGMRCSTAAPEGAASSLPTRHTPKANTRHDDRGTPADPSEINGDDKSSHLLTIKRHNHYHRHLRRCDETVKNGRPFQGFDWIYV